MRSLDGVSIKKPIKKETIRANAIRQTRRIEAIVKTVYPAKILKLLDHFEAVQIIKIISILLLTFTLSIGASQVLAKNNPQQKTTASSPETNAILAVSTIPATNYAMSPEVLSKPEEVYLPEEKIALPDPLKHRKEFLEEYLKSKKSILAEHVDALSEQTQWKLIIAISRAESSFCKKHIQYNCWGIGGAWNPKKYQSYDQAIADVNRILQQHYINAGLKTPAQIEKKWVGYKSDNWQEAVQEELDNLNKIN